MPIIRATHDFDERFTQIPNSWIRDPRLTLKAKGLLAQIMSHSPGWIMSVKTLATANQCGVDMIRSAIDELMKAGYLTRSVERERNDQGHLQDYTYITHDPQTPTSDYPTLDYPTQENPTTKNTIIQENNIKRNNAHLEELFDKFWELYPRKVGKGSARQAFMKQATVTDVNIILGGTDRLANDPNLPEVTYIPHPSTWLNRQGWDDEPYPYRERTKEEQERYALAQARAEREREIERSRKLQEEMAEARAKATPAPDCEHGMALWKCRVCTTRLAKEAEEN